MKLHKGSVLGAIDADRYRSCLLTTFSFDPSFMHQRVVPYLRSSGVRNVLALVDGDMLAATLTKHSLAGHITHPHYGIWPIYRQKGVFHPKVLLCLGPEHGLLAIGSGNLTSAGHGGNDELWSLFTVSPEEDRHLPLFAEVWTDLVYWAADMKGWAQRQLSWARDHTPWLRSDVVSPTPMQMRTPQGDVISYVSSHRTEGLQSVVNTIAGRAVDRITVLSPFMDERAKLLGDLAGLTKRKIRCVVDDEHGAVPSIIPDHLQDRLVFYRWSEVQQLHDVASKCVLHAKAVLFELKDGTELCMQGSANASVAAMGGRSIKPINAEAGIIIENRKGGFLERLGVRLVDAKAVQFDELNRSKLNEPRPSLNRPSIRLLSVAAIGTRISVNLEGEVKGQMNLRLRDAQNMTDTDVELIQADDRCYAEVESEEIPSLAAIFSQEHEQISNWQIVQIHERHIRNDPDRRSEQVDDLLDQLEMGDDDLLAEIVPYLTLPNFIEATSTVERTSIGDPLIANDRQSPPAGKGTPYVDYDELMKGSALTHESSTVHRVVDVLINNLTQNDREEQIAANDQDVDQDSANGSGPALGSFELARSKVKPLALAAFKRRRKKLLNYIRSYRSHLEKRLEPLTHTGNLHKCPAIDVKDDDYAHAIVFSRMLMHYVLRTRDNEDDEVVSECYLKLQGEDEDDNMLTIVPSTIGAFQLLIQQEAIRKRPEWTQKRYERYRSVLLADQLYCICNVPWGVSQHWFEILLLNHLKLIDLEKDEKMQVELAFQRLQDMRVNRIQCPQFDSNVRDAWNFIQDCFPYRQSICNKDQKHIRLTADLDQGNIIYNGKLGFCYVEAMHPVAGKGPEARLVLSRPGLTWNDEIGDYSLEHIFRSNLVLPIDQ